MFNQNYEQNMLAFRKRKLLVLPSSTSEVNPKRRDVSTDWSCSHSMCRDIVESCFLRHGVWEAELK